MQTTRDLSLLGIDAEKSKLISFSYDTLHLGKISLWGPNDSQITRSSAEWLERQNFIRRIYIEIIFHFPWKSASFGTLLGFLGSCTFFHLHFVFPLRCQTAWESDGVARKSPVNSRTMFLFNHNIKITNQTQFLFLLWLSKLYILKNFKVKQRNLLQWFSVIS